MCYYISITPKLSDLELRFGAIFKQPDLHQPIFSASAFNYPEIPVVSNEDREHIQYYRWGLVPSWVKDTHAAEIIRQRTLNARAETVFQKPSFRHAVRSKRCLILADGFFEWRHENKKAYPYYIRLNDRSLFAIAGIWDVWINPKNGETSKTCSVVTTAANTLLERVHNTRKRMPVILRREYESKWLEDNLSIDQIRSMLLTYDANEMDAYTVPSIVNRLGFNTTNAKVLDHHTYDELPDIKI